MATLLSHKVYEQLSAALLNHRLKPGDRLNRRQVAEDLGVSVAPVPEPMTLALTGCGLAAAALANYYRRRRRKAA